MNEKQNANPKRMVIAAPQIFLSTNGWKFKFTYRSMQGARTFQRLGRWIREMDHIAKELEFVMYYIGSGWKGARVPPGSPREGPLPVRHLKIYILTMALNKDIFSSTIGKTPAISLARLTCKLTRLFALFLCWCDHRLMNVVSNAQPEFSNSSAVRSLSSGINEADEIVITQPVNRGCSYSQNRSRGCLDVLWQGPQKNVFPEWGSELKFLVF